MMLFIFLLATLLGTLGAEAQASPVDRVNPFIGTTSYGTTHPGAVPRLMPRLMPESTRS